LPFTLAHPAAVLPLPLLMGPYAVFSALVIGSLAPDLPYFLGDPLKRKTTHTLASVIWFSLPIGWAVYLLFEHVMRRAIVFVLPKPFRERIRGAPQVGAPGPVTVSLLVGALTHLAWDALTHELGAYALLQVASTLGGLGVIAGVTLRWLRESEGRKLKPLPAAIEYRRFVARILVVATFVCTTPLAILGLELLDHHGGTHPVLVAGHGALSGLGATAFLLTLGGLYLRRGGLGRT
jgi:hypothetical protein